ncbi:hypothetical protein [Pelagibacterium luteolum]|uniref:Bacteriophage holin of superfamily 6 (Holin_LLH) n=1 Tax=Pelagibacterium luteolum TaxID=440168 RepID=A0A1G7ZJ00_9HYPH|nr:hypothetical protein [Pelagibacterium luteolum]SDH08693.1 hypothetical protein SAMN04487974_12046 [Pelagibacterium luteolum]
MSPILINTLIEHLLVPFVILPFVAWIAARIHQWTGKEVEARHREALQSALQNGVLYAIDLFIERGGKIDVTDPNLMGSLLADAKDYVFDSVPDAIKHFRLDDFSLEKLLRPKLPTFTDAEALAMNNAATGHNQTHIPRR